jgi:hypothetical protein
MSIMETYHKNRLLFFVLIFLIVVNLAALGTYLFYPVKTSVVACGDEGATPGCLYQTRLDLTDEQTRQVDQISEEYLKVSRPLADSIKKLHGEILDELSVTDPDKSYLNDLTEELAEMQVRLQKENIDHYLALKQVCTPEQALRLANLYRELYGCPMYGPDRKVKHRHHGR